MILSAILIKKMEIHIGAVLSQNYTMYDTNYCFLLIATVSLICLSIASSKAFRNVIKSTVSL